ncbi:flagellar hook-associated protein FlgL [Alkalicoccus chagannorensis]|uniref:flagellar hook-associated protein FlgL n=1 Tax=Alkalicoccus chagannorensis TaxID=427072 RepID=UPI0004258329|nr:flagellar hook-associated protein FlgL [Alkalicoccus chagannorensis]
MRVTQSMVTMNSLTNLSKSYEQLKTSQEQLSTGKKISRASEDPVIAMNGIRYRSQVTETEQFNRNLSEAYNWTDTSDATLDKGTDALHRVRELTVQAANDSYESGQRGNIAQEVRQLREHLASLGNTQNNNKFIFNGTDTTNEPIDLDGMDIGTTGIMNALDGDDVDQQIEDGDFPVEVTHSGQTYQLAASDEDEAVFETESGESLTFAIEDGEISNITRTYTGTDAEGNEAEQTETLRPSQVIASNKDAVSTNDKDVSIELLKGVKVPVNVKPEQVFSNQLFGDLKQLENMLEDETTETSEISEMLDHLDFHIDNSVNERAELGARVNRIEMIDSRIQEQEVIAKRILSDNEDADMEKVITEMMSQENVHRAALSSSARIMQPTLMDFLR